MQDGATSPCYDADFLPFGYEKAIVNTCSQNYKFEGKERDPETNNDNFGARYYSNHFGRWLSPDWSSVPAPVPYANLGNPQTLNLYAMVSDNPETFADLDGHGCGESANPSCDQSGGQSNENAEPCGNNSAHSNVPCTQNGDPAGAAGAVTNVTQQKTNTVADPAQQQITSSYKPNGGNETVGEIAGRVCGETCGMKDSKTENESLANARDKIAHVRLNGIKKWGNNVQKHASLSAPVMRGAGYKASLQAVMNAVREDLKGADPTNGAIFYNMRTPAQAAGMGQFQGEDVHTVSGPYVSPSKYDYIVTYGPGP